MTEETTEKLKKLTPKEHLDIIAKEGTKGRMDMESHLNSETTIDELRSIESSIRTAIMSYAIEMMKYQPIRREKDLWM